MDPSSAAGTGAAGTGAPAAGTGLPEVLSSHDGGSPRGRPRTLLVMLCAAVVVLATAAYLRGERSPGWPSDCGVQGQANQCGTPSKAMTEGAAVTIVRDYCPGLDRTSAEDVQPQPLDVAGLGDHQALAATTGSERSGTEDAILGWRSSYSWVTRWVRDGRERRLEVRCRDDRGRVASLRLPAPQLRSTVAAASGRPGRHIDFAKVAAASTATVSAWRPREFSVGFHTCDTGGLDLRDVRTGDTFTCAVEVYGPLGKGGYLVRYRVTAQRPYFERVDPDVDAAVRP